MCDKCREEGLYTDYPLIEADRYNPFENIKRDEGGVYVLLEDGKKLRLPSPLNLHIELTGEDDREEIIFIEG